MCLSLPSFGFHFCEHIRATKNLVVFPFIYKYGFANWIPSYACGVGWKWPSQPIMSLHGTSITKIADDNWNAKPILHSVFHIWAEVKWNFFLKLQMCGLFSFPTQKLLLYLQTGSLGTALLDIKMNKVHFHFHETTFQKIKCPSAPAELGAKQGPFEPSNLLFHKTWHTWINLPSESCLQNPI